MKDYYKTLGVARSATHEEIKKAYRKLAHQYHPDRGGDEARFKEVNEAYQVLSDTQKRQQYDQFGQTFEGGRGQGFNPFGSGAGGFDFGDVFEEFFGMGKASRHEERGRDIEIGIDIKLEDAFSGLKRTFTYDRFLVCDRCSGTQKEPDSSLVTCSTCRGVGKIKESHNLLFGMFNNVRLCPECLGSGKVPEKKCTTCYGEGRIRKQKEVEVTIPAGIGNNDTVKVVRAGEAGRNGSAGDLYVRVRVLKHKEFTRKGDDLLIETGLSVSQAVLGDTVKVKTIDGTVNLHIPAGTQHGELIRLKGKGMPSLIKRNRGDEYVHIRIEIPKKLSRKAKQLLEQLREEGV